MEPPESLSESAVGTTRPLPSSIATSAMPSPSSPAVSSDSIWIRSTRIIPTSVKNVIGDGSIITIWLTASTDSVVSQKVKDSDITEQDPLLLAATFSPAIEFKAICHAHLRPPSVKAANLTGLLGSLYSEFGPLLQTRNLLPIAIFYGSSVKYFNHKSVPAKDSFNYSNSDSQELFPNFYRAGRNKMGGAFNSNKEITFNQMRSSACTMFRTLIQLMRTLDKMPEECTILMKLLYYNNVKPANYELPFFWGCTEEEAHIPWTKHRFKIDIRNVSSKHFVLAFKVKSVLDPCEDENDGNQDDAISLDGDCTRRDKFSGSDSEGSHSDDEKYIIAPRDGTRDPVWDELAYGRVKDWINSYHLETVALCDVLSNSSDISVVMISEILDKLEKESILSKSGANSCMISKTKKCKYEFDVIREENHGQPLSDGKKSPQQEDTDTMYMKALYHDRPLDYISVAKLQTMLIEEMNDDGFVEAKGSKKLGKCVIHSHRLLEVKKLLDFDAMDTDVTEPRLNSERADAKNKGNNDRDMSTCGILHSIGSDLTHSVGKAELLQNGAGRMNQALSGAMDHDKTPTSRIELVKKPILQYVKYQKAQAVKESSMFTLYHLYLLNFGELLG